MTKQSARKDTDTCKAGNIIFFDKDDPRAAQALRSVISRSTIPVFGLILKVKEGEQGEEQIVNWMYADEDYIKSLALILPNK